MLRTVEEAMSQAINWWGDLPPRAGRSSRARSRTGLCSGQRAGVGALLGIDPARDVRGMSVTRPKAA